jgi:transposase
MYYSLSGDIFTISTMSYRRTQFEQVGFDPQVFKSYFHRKTDEYLRKRLRCVELFAGGEDFESIAHTLSIHERSVRKYVNLYIKGGFGRLTQAVKRPQKCSLSPEQEQAFKQILLTQRPHDMGLAGNIWTGDLMRQYLKNTYQTDYKSGIYDLLERLGLTHQKAHADYGNADPEKQKLYLQDLKQTLFEANEKRAVLKFDEFSICQKPSSYYGWALKNTRPRFVTDEKKETAPTAY